MPTLIQKPIDTHPRKRAIAHQPTKPGNPNPNRLAS